MLPRLPAVLASMAFASGAVAADRSTEPWASLTGSGLLTLQDTRTLAPGRVSGALTVNNRDRDPLGLDLLDGALAVAAGVGPATEVRAEWVVSRVVALPEAPASPPPPLDLVLLPGGVLPAGALYSIHWPVPYVDKRGSDRFDDFLPGGLKLGAKHRFRTGSGVRPALAAFADLTIPVARERADLQSGSGTGAVDLTLGGVAEWNRGPTSLVASLGYTKVGGPPDGDRVLEASRGAAPRITERPLDLPDRLDTGVGVRRVLNDHVALVLEADGTWDVGSRTPVVDARSPLDVLGGLQLRWRGGRMALGLRYHGRSLPSGAERRPPLAGWVDVTDVGDATLARYLDARGAGGAAEALRPGVQRVVSPPGAGDPPLPNGARIIPETYGVRSEHQVGFLFLWGWVF